MTAPEGKREFRILGPLEARENGRALVIGTGKQRALLALLLLDAGVVVSTDRLIDALWGERPPASALNSVHIYVSQLRKVLGEGCLITRGHGYLLALEPEQVDLGRFERLLGEGRELLAGGKAKRASDVLRAALALWRGPPLAEIASEPFAQGEIARLEELRLAALEERIEADLALGRHSELGPELEALVRAHPLRERLRAQLMLALYRSGRQAEALETYRQARTTLVEEVGLEPGRRLQELERAILSQDPTLDLPAPAAAPLREPRRRGRLLIAIGATLLLAAAVAVAVIELTRGDGARRLDLGERAGNVVGVLDADSGDVKAAAELTAPPTAVAAGRGYIWAASADSNAVYAIDPATNTVHDKIEVGNAPGGIAVGGGYVWVTNSLAGTVSQIDPNALIVLQEIHVGNGPTGVAVGRRYVWVANTFDHTVSKLRASTGKFVRNYSAGTDPGAVAVGKGAVWVASRSGGTVVKLNPDTGRVLKTITVGQVPAAVAVGLGSVWVANSEDGTVMRINPALEKVVGTTPVGDGPSGIAIVGGKVWTANEGGTVSRIDPAERLPETIAVENRPSAVAAGDGTVYVALRPTGIAHRGGTLTVALPLLEPLTTLDLAVGSVSTSLWRFGPLTNDGLLAYRHVGGQAGNQLVPDLARSLPDVSDAGKTYTFRLRQNIPYSNGRLVRASDFRYAIERLFKLRLRTEDNPVEENFRAIRGADRCRGRRCNLAAGIVTNDVDGTVEFHLSAPDPYFLYKLTSTYAAVVPTLTSLQEQTRRPLPATGPYRIESVTGDSVLLARNPYFHEWSETAQPAAFPDRIVLKGVPVQKGIALVEHGKADLMSNQATPQPFSVAPRFRPWTYEHPLAGLAYLYLDHRRPPFDDPRARRALNYALDRNKVLELTRGGSTGRPTCQVLPPNFPGYRRYCPYTLPSGDGAWSAPDRARAARLVEASGTRGASVGLWVDRDFAGPRVGRYLKRVLASLGYRPQLRESFPGTPRKYFARLERGVMSHDSGPRVAFGGWSSDFPAASGFIRDLFSCRSIFNYSRFCDPALERKIRRAVELEQTDLEGANRLWARLDREITDKALWVPLFNGYRVDFVSKRVRNYQYSQWYGTLISQLWVR